MVQPRRAGGADHRLVCGACFRARCDGLALGNGRFAPELLQWRWPRILSALIAGVMLAVAGCIIQRLTGNPMASPEVLGISSGAAFGVVLMLFLVPGNAFGWLMPAGSIGAAVTLMIILIASGRGGFRLTGCCWPGWRSAPPLPCC